MNVESGELYCTIRNDDGVPTYLVVEGKKIEMIVDTVWS